LARHDERKKAGIAPGLLLFLSVMRGLVPGIHVLLSLGVKERGWPGQLSKGALRAFARP
jgi:hypothetical protein